MSTINVICLVFIWIHISVACKNYREKSYYNNEYYKSLLLQLSKTCIVQQDSCYTIFGDTLVQISAAPFMVFLQKNTGGQCAGTLVSKNMILTAAHCLDNASEVSIMLGTNNLLNNGLKLQSDLLFKHEDYSTKNKVYDNDIALIKLRKEVSIDYININVINISSASLENVTNEKCLTVLVWNEGEITKTCGRIVKGCFSDANEKDMDSSKICVTGDIYEGASGGPLLFVDGKQIGLVSGGVILEKEGNLNKKIVFTYLPFYKKWIENRIHPSSGYHNLIYINFFVNILVVCLIKII